MEAQSIQWVRGAAGSASVNVTVLTEVPGSNPGGPFVGMLPCVGMLAQGLPRELHRKITVIAEIVIFLQKNRDDLPEELVFARK